MACCNKQGGCSKQEKELPKDALLESLSGISVDLVGKLLQVAAAGLRANTLLNQLGFADTKAGELAKRIADLAIENAYMRSVFNFMAPMDVKVTDSVFTINFGPNHGYALQIPVTSRNTRSEIAKQLRAAAEQLEIESGVAPLSDQKVFSFVEQ